VKKHQEQGLVTDRALVLPRVDVAELLGRRLEAIDLQIFEAAPFRLLSEDILHPLARLAGRERPLAVGDPETGF
jgi:hypothetical protein